MNIITTQLTIHLNDLSMTEEERDKATRRLLQQLKTMDEVESAHLVVDPNPSPTHKAIAGTLIGLLNAQATGENALKVLGFLGDRWGDKPIELELEINGRKLKIKACSREEFAIAQAAAQAFIATQQDTPTPLTGESSDVAIGTPT
jgi:hypothetical protein